ncbi:uncharacterized protein [Setaria viridis]|uniref:Late embryogenesis abundant protein LEA-2 subgroup domain-containing protein n=1 Tax=Setaria viridis TaxID=4556 RepID=A0A4U6TRL4_SETVI|nr:hypothetical protein SEVIR_7G174900v2 [Setaria viridis]
MEPDLETGLSTSHAPAAAAAAAVKPEAVIACTFVAAVLITGAFIAFYPQDTLLPTFSVGVAGVEGLDGGGPGPAATVNATFDLALHGATRRRLFRTLGVCNERGTVAVSYAGAVLAWGRVPRFCVPAQGQERVSMVALGGDVELSDELRGRLASERLSRTAELDVDIMLDRQRYLSCRVKLDEPSHQPSPCKVFILDWINNVI